MFILVLISVIAFCAGCSDTSQTDKPNDTDSTSGDDAGTRAETDSGSKDDTDTEETDHSEALEHNIEIVINEEQNRIATDVLYVYGYVEDTTIETIKQVPALTVGDCTMYEPEFRECTPECSAPLACGQGDQCLERLPFIDMGAIDFSGLKRSYRLFPVHTSIFSYYTDDQTDAERNQDLVSDNARVTASAEGNDIPAFQLETIAPEKIDTTLPCPTQYDSDSALVVRWTQGSGDAHVRLVLSTGNHADQFTSIVCESDDDGEIVVDASLMSAYTAEWRPFELWKLVRYNESHIEVDDIPISFRIETTAQCMM